MPFLMKYHAVVVFQCSLPEQCKQSTETLVELRPRNSTCLWMVASYVSTLVCLHVCLLYVFESACLCVYVCVCVSVFFEWICQSVLWVE